MPTKIAPVKADYPRILTAPPGPKAKTIIAKDKEFSSPSYIKEYPLAIAGGKGAMVEDVDGNRYIDWMAGIAVNSTGYRHPVVTKAVVEAAEKFTAFQPSGASIAPIVSPRSAGKPSPFPPQCSDCQVHR